MNGVSGLNPEGWTSYNLPAKITDQPEILIRIELWLFASTAEKNAAVDFGKAAAIRPRIVGEALREVAADPDISATLFDVLETERILGANAALAMIPRGAGLLTQLLASEPTDRLAQN
jgi:hypothetical protein